MWSFYIWKDKLTFCENDFTTVHVKFLISEIQGGPKSKLKTFVHTFAEYGPIFNFFQRHIL